MKNLRMLLPVTGGRGGRHLSPLTLIGWNRLAVGVATLGLPAKDAAEAGT